MLKDSGPGPSLVFVTEPVTVNHHCVVPAVLGKGTQEKRRKGHMSAAVVSRVSSAEHRDGYQTQEPCCRMCSPSIPATVAAAAAATTDPGPVLSWLLLALSVSIALNMLSSVTLLIEPVVAQVNLLKCSRAQL